MRAWAAQPVVLRAGVAFALRALAVALLGVVVLDSRGAAAEGPMQEWLAPTPWIESEAPEIRALAARLTADAGSPREAAVRLHDYVRDEVRFGWTRRFYRMTAREVLGARIGYCNTKATLFVALLRAAGIPARQHFVDLTSQVLAGLVDTGGPYVDHSYTEVFLDGTWRRVDSYVVDRALFERARAALAADGRRIGLGVHVAGTVDWDGRGDAFVQMVDDGTVPGLVARDHGVFADTRAFYAAVAGRDELAGARRLLIPLLIGTATARADALRRP